MVIAPNYHRPDIEQFLPYVCGVPTISYDGCTQVGRLEGTRSCLRRHYSNAAALIITSTGRYLDRSTTGSPLTPLPSETSEELCRMWTFLRYTFRPQGQHTTSCWLCYASYVVFESPSLYIHLIAGVHDKRGAHIVPVQAVRRTDVKVNGLGSSQLSKRN